MDEVLTSGRTVGLRQEFKDLRRGNEKEESGRESGFERAG